jgi:hypothetical protein
MIFQYFVHIDLDTRGLIYALIIIVSKVDIGFKLV